VLIGTVVASSVSPLFIITDIEVGVTDLPPETPSFLYEEDSWRRHSITKFQIIPEYIRQVAMPGQEGGCHEDFEERA
jgi:hypothetical protein